ncbi:MAG TPA: MFS transporter [Bryobacteraceae bacterium]|nr:MFS transporter [Bryobacteraceae bacterium]
MDVLPQSAGPAPQKAPAGKTPAGKTLPGFLLSGFLMALPGAILPVWGFYRDPPAFATIGTYFLSLAGGMLVSVWIARRFVSNPSRCSRPVLACSVAAVALVALALVPPLAAAYWRSFGLAILGMGAGLFNLSMFAGLPAGCAKNPAAAVNRGGIWYGLGCLTAALVAAITLGFSSTTATLLVAAVPGVFGILYLRGALSSARDSAGEKPGGGPEGPAPLAALLFALLLFFQFGNEWSVAGWLPLFLIRRIGFSPGAALRSLALYWLFLLLGRLVAVAALPRLHHGVLLGGSILAALFGCLLLDFTNNGFGATGGILLVGSGYASVYPLVAEAIGQRFPFYRPTFFGRIFSLGTLGGLLAPASIGYAAARFDIGVTMGVPLIGTCLVLLLIVSIWIEARFAA